MSDNQSPSLNCANGIIIPVFLLEDVAEGGYETASCIAIAYAYGFDVCTNELEKLSSKTTSYKDIILCVCST